MASTTEKIVDTNHQAVGDAETHDQTHVSNPESLNKEMKEEESIDEEESRDVKKVKTQEDTQKGPLVRRVTTEGEDYLLPGPKLYLIVFSLMLCVFCVALDNTILAVAIPRITDGFRSLDDVGWYISVYLLTSCCK